MAADWTRTPTPRHLYLPGPHRGVWNPAGVRGRGADRLRVDHRRVDVVVRGVPARDRRLRGRRLDPRPPGRARRAWGEAGAGRVRRRRRRRPRRQALAAELTRRGGRGVPGRAAPRGGRQRRRGRGEEPDRRARPVPAQGRVDGRRQDQPAGARRSNLLGWCRRGWTRPPMPSSPSSPSNRVVIPAEDQVDEPSGVRRRRGLGVIRRRWWAGSCWWSSPNAGGGCGAWTRSPRSTCCGSTCSSPLAVSRTADGGVGVPRRHPGPVFGPGTRGVRRGGRGRAAAGAGGGQGRPGPGAAGLRGARRRR